MNRIRLTVQLLFTIVTNGYLYGFLNGKIYRGGLKYACVPGLNCYSCPGAVGSCPIGALQALLNQRGFHVPFAALGFFFLFGSLLGRFVCGWLCPFGLVQDLLHKVRGADSAGACRLHVFVERICQDPGVLQISVSLRNPAGSHPPAQRQRRPAQPGGRAVPVEAGGSAGYRPYMVYRPFCQYLCPLGAIYGWFNRFSLVQIHWEQERCTSCKACEKACPVALSLQEISRSPECIRCGKCVDACPEQCLHFAGGRHPGYKPEESQPS